MSSSNNSKPGGGNRSQQRNPGNPTNRGEGAGSQSHNGNELALYNNNNATHPIAVTQRSGPSSSFPVGSIGQMLGEAGTGAPLELSFPSRIIRPHDTSRPGLQPEPQSRPEPSGALARASRPAGFKPMSTSWPAEIRNIWAQQLAATGASPYYKGNPFLETNQSAQVPEELNTALWITNLPPTCTHRQLLNAIRGCGKIYATVINPPEEDARIIPYGMRPTHTTSASKLVFFDRQGVDRLVAQAKTGRFTVGTYVPRVRPNRIKSAPREAGPQCRVLHIEGPSLIVNQFFLNEFFCSKFTYELESVQTLATFGEVTRQEWRFGSFRCQAESARQSIARERERHANAENDLRLWGQVTVYYGVDPCA